MERMPIETLMFMLFPPMYIIEKRRKEMKERDELLPDTDTETIFCPNCGAKVELEFSEDFELEVRWLDLETLSGECGKCEWKLTLERRDHLDQAGQIEIIFH